MTPYRDIDHDSGVAGYDEGPDFIRVLFKDGAIYRYTDASAGGANIQQMKRLAASGDGLNAFINARVRRLYAQRER